MFSNRVFQVTLGLSLLAHGVILLTNPDLNLFPVHKKTKSPELIYLKVPEREKTDLKKEALKRREPFLKIASKVTAQRRIPPPFVNKEDIFKTSKTIPKSGEGILKPNFAKPDVIAIKKKITLPPIGLDKINDPSYISYYQIVREKIKRAAYQNYTRVDTGEVYLTFAISSDGALREVRLVEEKSSPNQYLKQIALGSVKQASPFPAFPKELNYPDLSFNVVISFEIE